MRWKRYGPITTVTGLLKSGRQVFNVCEMPSESGPSLHHDCDSFSESWRTFHDDRDKSFESVRSLHDVSGTSRWVSNFQALEQIVAQSDELLAVVCTRLRVLGSDSPLRPTKSSIHQRSVNWCRTCIRRITTNLSIDNLNSLYQIRIQNASTTFRRNRMRGAYQRWLINAVP